MSQRTEFRRCGFTLIELLVVMAVIAILIAMLLPAVQQAREAARRAQCKNHLKQIGLALHGYHDSFRVFPPGWVWTNSYGWAAMLLPYLDQAPLYNTANFGVPITAAFAANTVLDVFQCASDSKSRPFESSGVLVLPTSAYPGCYGSGALGTNRCNGLLYSNGSTAMRSVIDGTSNTFAGGERDASRQGYTWWVGTDDDNASDVVGTTGVPFGTGAGGFGSQHVGGGHMLLADGSVHFFSTNIDSNTFTNMGTIAGGEVEGSPPIATSCGGASRYCGAGAPVISVIIQDPRPATAGQVVTLRGSAFAPGGTITTYEWDLNFDGAYDRSGDTVSGVFSVGQTVRLRVKNNCGLTATRDYGVQF